MKFLDLKNLFNSWAKVNPNYVDQQWMLSNWEILEGVEWPQEKISLMVDTIEAGLDIQPMNSVIDLGCGGGWIASCLKGKCKNICGLDFSLDMLIHSQKKYPEIGAINGEIGLLPVKDETFDRVLSYFVFINFIDDTLIHNAILDILRILKPGGKILIGQLPSAEGSVRYDQAKQEYLAYCQKNFKITKSVSDEFKVPIKLFDKQSLTEFLDSNQVSYKFLNSFNPFYHPGAEKTIDWRFDLVLEKSS